MDDKYVVEAIRDLYVHSLGFEHSEENLKNFYDTVGDFVEGRLPINEDPRQLKLFSDEW